MRSTVLPLATTLAVQALVSMAVLTVPVVAPAASSYVGISAGYIGVFIALVYGAAMVSSLACGDLVRRLGAIRVSQACLVLAAAGLAVAAGGTLPLLVAGALLLGAGYGSVTPASSHVLARTTAPHMMSLVFSLKQTGVPIGGALAGALVPLLVFAAGWQWALVAVAAACVVTALASQSIRASLDSDHDPHRRLCFASVVAPLHVVFSNDDVRRLALCSFLFSSLQLCLVTYLVTYLTTNLSYTLLRAGLMLSVAQGAGILGRIAWGALADRLQKPILVLAIIAAGMALAAIGTALFSTRWPLALVMAICATFGATAIGWNGVFLAEVARRAPRGKAVDATGGALFFTYFGVLVAPPLFGLIVEQGLGYSLAYAWLALPALLSGLWLMSQHRADEAETSSSRSELQESR